MKICLIREKIGLNPKIGELTTKGTGWGAKIVVFGTPWRAILGGHSGHAGAL